jgi:hypothetical protein
MTVMRDARIKHYEAAKSKQCRRRSFVFGGVPLSPEKPQGWIGPFCRTRISHRGAIDGHPRPFGSHLRQHDLE